MLGIVVVLCAIYAVLTQFVMPRVLTQALPYAQNLAANYINGSVSIGKIEWNGGFTVILRDVEVDDVQHRPVAKLPETRVTVNPFMALSSTDKAISAVAIREPVLYVTQDTQGKWNIQNLMKPSQSDTTPFYGIASVEDGTVVVSLPQGRWEFGVNGKVDGSHNPVFDLDFTVTNPAMDPVHLTGGLTTKGVGKVHFVTDRVDLAPFASLAAHYGQVREAGGEVVKLNGFWHNDGQDTLLQGTVTLRDVHGVRAFGGRDWKFSVSGTVTGTDHAMSTQDLTLTLNGQVIHLDGDVDYSDLDHLRGTIHADAPSLTYGGQTVRNVHVDGALVDSVAFLREASLEYGGGTVKASGDYDLKSGALTAQTQIDHVTVTVPARQDETIGVNAELALQGTLDRENAKLKASLAAHTFNLTWRGMTLKVVDFDTDVTEQGADIHTLSAFMGPGALTATGRVGFDGSYDLRGKLADIAGRLPASFDFCHSYLLIDLDRVEKLQDVRIFFDNGRTLEVGKGSYVAFRKRFTEYLRMLP
jgi:translocation and assembly module TamB